MRRIKVEISGVVQGVGFRPYLYKLAKRYGLYGFVFNDTKGAVIEIEGRDFAIRDFLRDMKINPPPLAFIDRITTKDIPLRHEKKFLIRESRGWQEKFTLISPDISICDDCLRELFHPQDRRFKYPFINCTNCGPRFTIIEDIPYDRKNTTMRQFKMCKRCLSEYEDPENRRFHAQPNACAVCGPEVKMQNAKLKVKNLRAPIKETARMLIEGKILAIKGLGGYHLACDATNTKAVGRLRKRKFRQDKPFALMCDSIEAIKKICLLTEKEEALLTSPRRPIVLLQKRRNRLIAKDAAPQQNYLGVMLPYTPLHYLLFYEIKALGGKLAVLVMTSGNYHDEPIAYIDSEAKKRLGGIADYLLIHNRQIFIRCDDSVTRVFNEKEYILRRSRGYAPGPLKLAIKFTEQVLACGGELKNTFCLGRDRFAFLSYHIGDLENLETLKSFEEGIEHFKRLFNIQPKVVAYDMHPEYLSTKYALNLKSKYHLIPVQHHHAHIASCMAENNLNEKVLGVVFDGLGYGDDGGLWGGEFLLADYRDFKRIAHLKYIPQLGAKQAILEPWRLAATWLNEIYGDDFLNLDIDFVRRLDKNKWKILKKLWTIGHYGLWTSSMGRLFDAVSSLIGVRDTINYEGQAAIELEMLIKSNIKYKISKIYNYRIEGKEGVFLIEPDFMIKDVVEDLKRKVSLDVISFKFHFTIAKIIQDVCLRIRKKEGLNKVVLSGGVFQNMVLLKISFNLLKRYGFEVFVHSKVPANDGGISLGQAVIANFKFKKKR